MATEKIKTTAKKYPIIVSFYRAIYRIYKEITLFIKLLNFHIKKLLFGSSSSVSWQHIHILFEIDGSCRSNSSVEQFLKEKTIRFKEGSYVYYLPPQNNLWLNDVLKNYPKDAALKILKTPGEVNERIYVRSRNKPVSQRLLFPNSYEMLYSCNYLSTFKITPRIYDLVYITFKKKTFTTFIVKHKEGREPSYEECIKFLDRIKTLIDKKLLSIISVRPWHRTEDFSCPHCSGNLLIDDNKDGFYVDFQNFVIDRNKAVKEELELSRGRSHFGSRYLVRKGDYLYQSVPQFSKYGKRDTDRRWSVIENMLFEKNLTLHEKVVFDVGCNIGMIIGACLNRGAFWCIGWDRRDLISHADKILSLLGYSRYNLYGDDISKNYQFHYDIPDHLNHMIEDAFLFFLSLRAHIGFPETLFKIPWKYMVYEDHQNEERNIDKHLSEINKIIQVRVLFRTSVVDGDSSSRPLLLLEKITS